MAAVREVGIRVLILSWRGVTFGLSFPRLRSGDALIPRSKAGAQGIFPDPGRELGHTPEDLPHSRVSRPPYLHDDGPHPPADAPRLLHPGGPGLHGQAAPAPSPAAARASLFPGHVPNAPPARVDILASLCLHQGGLGEGWPQAPGPSQLRAPPAARSQSPAKSPGFRFATRRPAQCPALWVMLDISLHLPWPRFIHLCIGATTPSFFSPNSTS